MLTNTEKMIDELGHLTKDMDIPEFRQKKIPWLSRNLGARNSNHPNFEKAMNIIKKLSKQGVR